jgi:predicted Zn-dependent protease
MNALRTTLFTLSAAAVFGAAACAVNPATGQREFSLVSEGQEIAMGRQADPEIVAQLGLYPDSAVQRYVSDLGLRLAAVSERPDLPWTFRVLDDPTVNAFALPGGFIYITRGILTHLESEAQLVGVLGHEIGHVTARHSASQMSRAQLAQIGLVAGMVFSETVRDYAGVASQSLGLLFLKFGRDDESQADELGIRYMTREGYDPRELAGVMRMLSRTSQLASGGGRAPEWLSTHPDPDNRSEAILAQVAEGNYASATTVERDGFLRRIDDMPFGPNPREGFVENGLFHHPDLAFRVATGGWAVDNQKAAVQFIEPNGNAAVILTIESGSPDAALQALGAQDGVTLGGASRVDVNGLPGVRARFEAQTQDGRLGGEVLFVEHGGATYRLLALSAAANWGSFASAARGIQNSFQVERDAGILSRTVDRLDMVTLRQGIGFDTFRSRYPSTVDPVIVALINQVEESATLRPGLWKRVVAGN